MGFLNIWSIIALAVALTFCSLSPEIHGQTICDDDTCGVLNGTGYFACCAGMTLRAYCLQKIAQNAVFLDGQCDRYMTISPTPEPTPAPTPRPTRFIFPTQSPQTQADYNSYFNTKAPTGDDGLPHPAPTSASGGSPVVGLAVGIVVVVGVFGAVFWYRRRHKKSRALHESEFGAGVASQIPVRANHQEYDVALT